MEFKTLFAILKKHMSNGYDVPQFFRELMAMITTVSEDEWGTYKDPSVKGKENSLRSYAKRTIPKKLAQNIVYHLTPENLTERINDMNDTQRQLMADDFAGYDPGIDADNVGDVVAEWMVEIIQTSAGLVQQSVLEKQKQEKLASDLKIKYGDYLLAESNNYCPSCGRPLVIPNQEQGKTANVYEVSLIDKNGEIKPDNLIALCPQCYATYLLDSSKKTLKNMQELKTLLAGYRQGAHLLDDMPLEQGIVGVITRIKNLKEKDLAEARLDPKEIKEKLSPAKDMEIYIVVNGYVTTYFLKIREIMINLDKRKEIDYEEIQDQMHAFYRRLKKAGKSHLEIFNEISRKIHRVTLQEDTYCQIVVSYFIQSCEVFDAITE